MHYVLSVCRCAFGVGFQIFRVSEIDKHAGTVIKASQTVLDDFAVHTTVTLSGRPSFISVNADSTTLSVCFNDGRTSAVHLYDIHSFKSPASGTRCHTSAFVWFCNLHWLLRVW